MNYLYVSIYIIVCVVIFMIIFMSDEIFIKLFYIEFINFSQKFIKLILCLCMNFRLII